MIPDFLLAHIIKEFHPQLLLLHGSRALGKHTKQSDWDFLMFPSHLSPSRVQPFTFKQQHIDIQSVAELSFQKNPQYIPYFTRGILVIDEDTIGSALQEEARLLYTEGPKALSSEEYEMRKAFLKRTLARLEDNIGTPIVFHYRFGAFYERIFRYWFELRRKWSLPLYEALPVLQDEDPAFFMMAEKIISTSDLKEKIDLAKNIYRHLFLET